MKTVDLETAFTWQCPTCEARNWLVGVAVEQTDEDKAAFAEDVGEEMAGGEWVMAPKTVKCANCKERFEANDTAGDEK